MVGSSVGSLGLVNNRRSYGQSDDLRDDNQGEESAEVKDGADCDLNRLMH